MWFTFAAPSLAALPSVGRATEQRAARIVAVELVGDQRADDRLGRHAVQVVADRAHELGASAADDADREVTTAELVEQLEHRLVDGPPQRDVEGAVPSAIHERRGPARRTARGASRRTARRARGRHARGPARPLRHGRRRARPRTRADRATMGRAAAAAASASTKKSNCTGVGRSHHRVPSLSKTATRLTRRQRRRPHRGRRARRRAWRQGATTAGDGRCRSSMSMR